MIVNTQITQVFYIPGLCWFIVFNYTDSDDWFLVWACFCLKRKKKEHSVSAQIWLFIEAYFLFKLGGSVYGYFLSICRLQYLIFMSYCRELSGLQSHNDTSLCQSYCTRTLQENTFHSTHLQLKPFLQIVVAALKTVSKNNRNSIQERNEVSGYIAQVKLSMCPGSRLPTVDKVQGCEGRINDNVPRKHTHTHIRTYAYTLNT